MCDWASPQVNGASVPVVPQQSTPTAQKSIVPLKGTANPVAVAKTKGLDWPGIICTGCRTMGATQYVAPLWKARPFRCNTYEPSLK
eukprot:CAMPEP_0117580724 /NCGR_PEP_ID=MMETSP0784-20121206/65386_1 /TAXON_ID=39447 /ORGANISM="" /LENGTH=85 /DNA_ID=CAMNT_0005380867 /DNA_START=269 /DNA_END=526 /DNA_ORIENTATION=-